MAYGKMNTQIEIITAKPTKDTEGFVTTGDTVLATVRAYKEVRNTSVRWERIIGDAAFTKVTALFRFRKIPGVTVDTTLYIADADGRYNIVSAEDVRGRGMYVEVMAQEVKPSG